MRAMTFDRLVRSMKFTSEFATTTEGRPELGRPAEVVTVNATASSTTSAALLGDAHAHAALAAATLTYWLAIPVVGFEDHGATEVKPDTRRTHQRVLAAFARGTLTVDPNPA